MTNQITTSSKRFHVAKTLDGYYPKFTPSGLKRIAETCSSTFPQLVKILDPCEERFIPICNSLNFDHNQSDKVISQLFSFKEYMEYALYDPDFGYYTTRPGIGTDFYTTPMKNSPYYGACLAELAFRQWKGMLKTASFSLEERFDVVQLGAGTGVLARDFVQHVKVKSGTDSLWKVFHDNLRYLTGEISPDLQQQQRATTEKFQDKIQVIPADARQLANAFGEDSIQGMIISNELPDAFSCHKIMKNQQGKLLIAVTVPVVKMFNHFLTGYSTLLSEFDRERLLKLLPKISRMHNFLQANLTSENGFFPSSSTPLVMDSDCGLLSKDLYQCLRRLKIPFLEMRITWKEFWVSIDKFPEVDQMQDLHRDLFSTLPPMKAVPFNSDLRLFQEGCGRILKKGVQMHIDYMYDNYEMKKWTDGFRTYPSTEIHDYTSEPGEEDITSDVNASALAVEGIRAKFTPFLFCSERELISQLPDFYPHIKIRSKGLPFHVLMMLKNGTESEYQPQVLTRPVTYRELFLKLSDWSCTAIPRMRYVKEKTALVSRMLFELLIKSESVQPQLDSFQQTSLEIMKRVDSENTILKLAIDSLLPRMIYFKTPLLTIAREYRSVSDFDYRRINSYFKTLATTDQVDRLMIQIIHQILHLHYTN